jgi:hypothetical protein
MIASPPFVTRECEDSAAQPAARHSPTTRKRKPWQPGERDHLAYEWIRFEGKRQWWVAKELGVDQSTVSRIVARYEKWLAHAQPGDGDQLDPAERQRVQRWLTYERNERILASALRIAGDMECLTDVSRSVVSRPMGEPAAEREVRTYHEVLDRSGLAARFLRLAFQINMQQLKLVDKEPLAPLAPLAEDDPVMGESLSRGFGIELNTVAAENEPTEAARADSVQRESLKLHNVHHEAAAKSGVKASPADTCAKNGSPEKMRARACTEEPESKVSRLPDRPPRRESIVLPCGINPFG